MILTRNINDLPWNLVGPNREIFVPKRKIEGVTYRGRLIDAENINEITMKAESLFLQEEGYEGVTKTPNDQCTNCVLRQLLYLAQVETDEEEDDEGDLRRETLPRPQPSFAKLYQTECFIRSGTSKEERINVLIGLDVNGQVWKWLGSDKGPASKWERIEAQS